MTTAAIVAFLMTAVKSSSVVMTAFVTLAVVVAAIMAFPVVMSVVVAFGVGIIRKLTLGQCLCRGIRRTGHATVELYPGLGQGGLRTHADPAADQGVGLRGFQETGQRAVAAAVGGYDLLRYDFAVLHVVELELLRVAEMLEDLSVFISYRNSHSI